MAQPEYLKHDLTGMFLTDQWCHYCGARLIMFNTPKGTYPYHHAPMYTEDRPDLVIWVLRQEFGELTYDHIVPTSKGGTDELSNGVLCCRSCNSRKSAKPYDQFVSEMDHEWQRRLEGRRQRETEMKPRRKATQLLDNQ